MASGGDYAWDRAGRIILGTAVRRMILHFAQNDKGRGLLFVIDRG
jgi:hypothetical protein